MSDSENNFSDADGSDARPSKSARKREANALKELGLELTRLSSAQLAQVPLTEELAGSLAEFRDMNSNGARRRHLLLIGKQLRSIDTDPIREALAALGGKSAEAIYEHAQLEQWRERLLNEDEALTQFLDAYPNTDRQQLRMLVRRARQAKDDSAVKSAGRALFRFLREQFG